MTTLAVPRPTKVYTRPSVTRLVSVELRKMVDTRAGFWLQVATLVITLVGVIVRSVLGDAADHTFASVLPVALGPASVLLPVVGILLVTSEWSQRTGMITFALVPVRSRVLGAKLVASLVLAFTTLIVASGIAAAGVLAAAPGVDATWSDTGTLIAQSAVYLGGGMVIGVAFGAIVLASAPAIVALFALPISWLAVTSLPFFGDVGPWLDTGRALDPLAKEVLSATQWAQVGTALALWMLVPLMLGIWRITRREVAV